MRNANLKVSLWILLVLSAIIWFLFAYFAGLDLSKISDFFGLIPEVITLDLIAITIFVKWLWRWKRFRGWLVPFPDLNGTWLGEIRSEWIDQEKSKKIPPIPAMLTVRQTFFYTSCVMQTKEMRSGSYGEEFQIDEERQIKQFIYSYVSRPKISLQEMRSGSYGEEFQIDEERQIKQFIYSYVSRPKISLQERSNIHHGTVLFEVIESPKMKLKGGYWTDRKTIGEMEFIFHSKKILEELPEDFTCLTPKDRAFKKP
jgi:hypothetical protein